MPVTVGGLTGTFNLCAPCAQSGLQVSPVPEQFITVMAGQTTPTVTFEAQLNCEPVSAAWSVDKGNAATIGVGPSSTATFAPTGNVGGLVTVVAGFNGMTVQRQVFIQLTASGNGGNPTNPLEGPQIPTSGGQLTAGGGVGGVGGEGLGTPVTNTGTLGALMNPTGSASSVNLTFLYPYNATVFPRGLLAPLIMWSWAPPGGPALPGAADAIEIQLSTTTNSFSYTGTFGPPAILMMYNAPFIRMPIPQDVWAMATNTAGGADQLTLSLTVAKNGIAYGPISQTWTIAPALLDGIIYYNSYGTELAQNYSSDKEGQLFGGAVLSIHVGDTGPKLIAGGTIPAGGNIPSSGETNPASTAGDPCRVCHSVAAFGSILVTQHDSNRAWGDGYSLSATNTLESPLSDPGGNPVADSTYSAIYPDGTKTLTRAGQMLALPAGTLTATQPTGLLANPYTPTFSPDGTRVAFNSNAGTKLTVMSFNNTTFAFTNAVTVVTGATGTVPAWPAFFPDSQSMVFHNQSNPGIDTAGAEPCTRGGALAQIAWTSVTGGVTALNSLNGKGYLPSLPTPSTLVCMADGNSVGAGATTMNPDVSHTDDVDHNYEPTVNPIGAGGYAWVVFTSRRMYGTVATVPPFCSDPRGVNLEANGANPLTTNITTKKLWVAAIDLSQAPGIDSSHPAFYLPGQEILAGNSRGFWVLDPCQASGTSCTSGDQCCGGYCEPNGPGGSLICSSTPPDNNCSAVGDKCVTSNDCCDTANTCTSGFCQQGS